MYFTHTKETIDIVYKRDGRYVRSALKKINNFLRDWRADEPTKMDPELIDMLWELHSELGSRQPIHIISAYRSSKTNKMLKRIGRNVARRSQHILGKAADVYFPDVPLKRLRESALLREQGGVGYYPRSGKYGFVHIDTGRVRHWPRMSEQQLAELFKNKKSRQTPAGENPILVAQREAASKRQIAAAQIPVPRTKPDSIAAATTLVANAVSTPRNRPAPVTLVAAAGLEPGESVRLDRPMPLRASLMPPRTPTPPALLAAATEPATPPRPTVDRPLPAQKASPALLAALAPPSAPAAELDAPQRPATALFARLDTPERPSISARPRARVVAASATPEVEGLLSDRRRDWRELLPNPLRFLRGRASTDDAETAKPRMMIVKASKADSSKADSSTADAPKSASELTSGSRDLPVARGGKQDLMVPAAVVTLASLTPPADKVGLSINRRLKGDFIHPTKPASTAALDQESVAPEQEVIVIPAADEATPNLAERREPMVMPRPRPEAPIKRRVAARTAAPQETDAQAEPERQQTATNLFGAIRQLFQ